MKLNQVMYKSRNITDFFKPFVQPASSKRLREDDNNLEDVLVLARPRSKSPKTEGLASVTRENSDLCSLHTTSSLSSLNSDVLSQDGHLVGAVTHHESREASETVRQDSNSSRGPFLSSSQRVVRKGEVVIRNSDDESDSDMSLGDLDDLLDRRKPTPRSSSTEYDLPLNDSTIRSQHVHKNPIASRTRNGGLRSKARTPQPLPVIPKYRFSLDSLVAQAEKDDAAEAGAKQARILVEELCEQRVTNKSTDNQTWETKGNLDEGLLASMVDSKGDGEIFDRLLHAIQRTEALHQEKSWSFFDPTEYSQSYEFGELPQFELKHRWQKIMNGLQLRQLLFGLTK